VTVVAPSRAAYLWVPPGATTAAGEECADLALSLGFQVDEPERDTLNVLMAEDAAGASWAGLEAAVICGRQNLKTWALLMTVIYDAWVRDVNRVVWTSHRFKTTQSAFEDLAGLVAANPWLSKSVRKERHASGSEGFELASGARIDFLARTSGGGRGLTGDTVILDEALYLQPAMMGALLPTLSARPDPHVRYGSSPGVLESGVLRSIRNRGRALNDPSLSYIEYTSPRESCADPDCVHALDVPGCHLDDEERWAQANPALGRRISVEYVRQERRALSAEPVEFMRERLGWWEDPPNESGVTVYPLDEWTASSDPASTVADGTPVAWAVDLSWNRATAYVAAVGRRDDGLLHAQIVYTGDPNGVAEWIGTRTADRPSLAVAVQGTGAPASSLLDEITRAVGASCPVVAMSSTDLAKACGQTFDAIKSGRIRHHGDPSLDRSVLLAVSRTLGDGWALDRRGSPVDVANLVAITNAVWALTSHDDTPPPSVNFF
jgi:hypothetical protein